MTRVIRGSQLVRLLGAWQPFGRRSVPDYLALADSLRGLLADGRLALGVRVPAERELAASLSVSRTTVTAAYHALRASGHLESRRGAGSWTRLPGGARVDTAGVWTRSAATDLIDLGTAALAAPPEMEAAAAEGLAALPRYLGGAGYHPTGLPELRAAVAELYCARGVPTTVEQIMITNGVQHALDLAVRLLVPPGSAVLTESPTYPNAIAAVTGRRARVHTYGLGADGWDEELLLGSIRQTAPRMAYLIPEFQNPTGHLMADELRAQLPAAAHSAGTDLVIDESFVDLRLDADADADADTDTDAHADTDTAADLEAEAHHGTGTRTDGHTDTHGHGAADGRGAIDVRAHPGHEDADAGRPGAFDDESGAMPMPPPVAAFDRHARVLTIGGMSKPYWGGLRIGWIRAAEPLVQRLAAVRVGVDMAGPVIDQLVAVAMLTRADAVVAARRKQLRTQRDALVAALRSEMPSWRFRIPQGGVSLWVELDAPISSALSRAAEGFGVRLAPGPRFGVDGTLERFIRLPFTLPAETLALAVSRLAAARSDLAAGARRAWDAPPLVA